MSGLSDEALKNAYAEGRKDEAAQSSGYGAEVSEIADKVMAYAANVAASACAPMIERDIEKMELLAWAYRKLHYRSFDSMDDALMLDRIKLLFIGDLL